MSNVPLVGAGMPSSAARAGGRVVDPALKKVAQQFEAIFLRQMLASMRQARLAEDAFASNATDNFRELADARTADGLATLGHFGIAQMIERQLAVHGGSK